MLFKRRVSGSATPVAKPVAKPPGAVAQPAERATAHVPVDVLLAVTREDQLQKLDGSAVSIAPSSTGADIIFQPGTGGVSRASISVSPGETYVVHVTATLHRAPTNGVEGECFVGPVFYGATGKTLRLWQKQPLPPLGERKTFRVAFTAPDGSVSVRIGMHSAWSDPKIGPTSDVLVAFGTATLTRI